MQSELDKQKQNSNSIYREMEENRDTLERLINDNTEKDHIIKQLQATIDSQEQIIGEIEQEMALLNNNYAKNQGPPTNNEDSKLVAEVVKFYRIDDKQMVIPHIINLKRKHKLMIQFVEKSWKLMR